MNGRDVLNLMAATRSGGDNNGSVRLAANEFREGLGDLQRQFVFGFQGAESASHAAAPGIEHRHVPARKAFGELAHVAGVGERLRMTMCVNDHVRGLGLESESVRLLSKQVFDKLFEKKTALADLLRAFKFQLAIILHKHGIAGRLEEKNRR